MPQYPILLNWVVTCACVYDRYLYYICQLPAHVYVTETFTSVCDSYLYRYMCMLQLPVHVYCGYYNDVSIYDVKYILKYILDTSIYLFRKLIPSSIIVESCDH